MSFLKALILWWCSILKTWFFCKWLVWPQGLTSFAIHCLLILSFKFYSPLLRIYLAVTREHSLEFKIFPGLVSLFPQREQRNSHFYSKLPVTKTHARALCNYQMSFEGEACSEKHLCTWLQSNWLHRWILIWKLARFSSSSNAFTGKIITSCLSFIAGGDEQTESFRCCGEGNSTVWSGNIALTDDQQFHREQCIVSLLCTANLQLLH